MPYEVTTVKETFSLSVSGYDIASRYIKAYLRHTYPHMFEEGIRYVYTV